MSVRPARNRRSRSPERAFISAGIRRKEVPERLRRAFSKGDPVLGRVTSAVKGGFVIQLAGCEAFCPGSEMYPRLAKGGVPDTQQRVEFLILRVGLRDVFVSRRQAACRLAQCLRRIDTSAPLHHTGLVRLTVNLDEDLYALARSLAQAEGCSVSVAVNRLVRRSFEEDPSRRSGSRRRTTRNGFVVSKGRVPITADVVRRIESEDDQA